MSDRNRNRPDSKKSTDEWLTPPGLIELLGPFETDPACAPVMPWRTAERMFSNGKTGGKEVVSRSWVRAYVGQAGTRPGTGIVAGDGLKEEWRGLVWLNPPYSDILPWAVKMAGHAAGGFMLVPAKSTDTQWAQHILRHCDEVLFFEGRLLFHYPNGKKSEGAWGPSMLAAFGDEAARRLRHASFEGVIFKSGRRVSTSTFDAAQAKWVQP